MVRVEGSVGEDGVDAEGQMSVTGGGGKSPVSRGGPRGPQTISKS